MNTILFISLITFLSSLCLAYISLSFAKTEEAKIINEIQVKYPNNTLYHLWFVELINYLIKTK